MLPRAPAAKPAWFCRWAEGFALALDRDRSYIIHEAIETYLDLQRWQMDHIREGLRQADAGQFATEAEMKSTFTRRRK